MATPNFEVEWRMIYEAPVGKPVLVWIPPPAIPALSGGPGRFEVGVAMPKDPRSGKVSPRYANNCRWTHLPRAPRQRVRIKPEGTK